MNKLKFIYNSTKMADLSVQLAKELFVPPSKTISYAGFFGIRNWGDVLNSILIRKLSGRVPLISPLGKKSNRCLLRTPEETYSCIGSILEEASKKKNLIVYGTGFLNSTDTIIQTPKNICAVRGVLTAERITDCIGDCPKIYGDPAVLVKEFYQPKVQQKYNLGIIPHWGDYQKVSQHFKNIQNVNVINIEADSTKFIDEICSCKYIASSSLHGLIMADAYGVPTTWLKMLSGMHPDDFKFYDYYSSVRCEREPINPLEWSIEDICSSAECITHQINRKKLLDACPFLPSEK